MSGTIWFAAALFGTVLIVVLWKALRRKKPKAWVQATRCPKCGWTGQTSRYAGRCPRCNTPIGDQQGKRE